MAEPVYRPVIHVAQTLFKALDLRIASLGQEHVPASGGGVVVINHLSFLDFTLAGIPFWYGQRRMVRFMAKDGVFRNPVSGPLMRGMKHIPVDRSAGAAAYQHAVAALQAGELVGVFPETTISESFTLMPFKTGAARMAVAAGVPALPLVLWGSQRTWTKGRRPQLRTARHVPISLTLGAPIPAAELGDPESGTRLLEKVMGDMLADAQRRYPAPPPGAPTWWLPAALGGTAPTPQEVIERRAAR